MNKDKVESYIAWGGTMICIFVLLFVSRLHDQTVVAYKDLVSKQNDIIHELKMEIYSNENKQ